MYDTFIKQHKVILIFASIIFILLAINYIPDIMRTFSNTSEEPLVVISDDESYEEPSQERGIYALRSPSTFPPVSARSYLIADLSTGQVLFEKNSQEVYPIASITKLMTAIVAQERLPVERITTISPRAQSVGGGLRGGLSTNQRITIQELLFPLLMTSSNNGAEAIAETFGRQFFIEQMNTQALNIGMWNTHFDDPSGLSTHNTSTADDLFLLMRYLFFEHTDILKISRLSFYSGSNQTWRNISTLIREPTFRGGKTGFTNAARQTSAGIYRISLDDEERLLIIVILGSESRQQDIRSIISYLERNVQYKTITERIK